MQNQQKLLTEVLSGQKLMAERQDKLETDMASFREEMSKLPSESPSSSPSCYGKRKRVVTRSLSVSLNLYCLIDVVHTICVV